MGYSVKEREIDRLYEAATPEQRKAYWAAIETAQKAFDKAECAAMALLTKA